MTNLFNSLTITQKRLLTLVKGGLWGKLTGTDLFEKASHAEWEELTELAAIQGVLGIAYDGMKELPQTLHPPKNILIKWALGVEAIEKRHQYQIKALLSIATLFKENNIRCLLLKGPGIGQLFPIPEHRESGDLDIYLFGNYEKGNRLMEERGIKVDYTGEIHSSFLFHSIPVENHYSFLHVEKNQMNYEYDRIMYQELSKQDSPLSEDLGVYVPSLSFNLLFLFNHAVRHFLTSGIVLRQICDWAILLDQCKDNRKYMEFYDSIQQFDLSCYANTFTLIASEYLGLSKVSQFVVDPDASFTEKVFSDIMNQKKYYPVALQRSRLKIFWRKVKGAVYLFRNRWKYQAISSKMFLSEVKFRISRISQIINEPKHVS